MTAPTDVDLQQLARSVGDHLLPRAGTLVTAESCTGGWIAKTCTDVAGSSRWFQGGVVAYSNFLKVAFLDVPEGLLARYGAVSEPSSRSMRREISSVSWPENCGGAEPSSFAMVTTTSAIWVGAYVFRGPHAFNQL